ncbi:MAG: hypothetical protein R3B91_19895 [Planctomycetaceae bacterium]
MSYAPDHEMYQDRDVFAIDAVASERAAFIRPGPMLTCSPLWQPLPVWPAFS